MINVDESFIKELKLTPNPRNPKWGRRNTSSIKKLIAHQELGEAETKSVHSYHISVTSHLKPKVGAPSIAYHYTIEKDGTVYKVNEDTAVTWHTAGQNIAGIGIMLVGDFTGPGHIGKSEPTEEQLSSLIRLFDVLRERYNIPRKSVYGHKDFGKQACPGDIVMKTISDYKNQA